MMPVDPLSPEELTEFRANLDAIDAMVGEDAVEMKRDAGCAVPHPGWLAIEDVGTGWQNLDPPSMKPRTEAGRRLLDREAYNARSFALITAEAIIAIEEEAARIAIIEQAEPSEARDDE